MSKSIPFHFINTMSQALTEIFDKKKHADRVIDKYVRANPNWKPDERKLFFDSVYEVLRNKSLLEFAVDSKDLVKISAAVQLLSGNKCNPHLSLQNLNLNLIKERMGQCSNTSIQFSIPEWLFNKLKSEALNINSKNLFETLNKKPTTYIRTNLLKIKNSDLIYKLKAEKISLSEIKINNQISIETLKVNEGRNIFATSSYRDGLFEMQDLGSQQIVPLLDVKPGMNVVDACSGSGGKTLQIASTMRNSGKLLAMDVVEKKLQDLKMRAEKAGINIIQTKCITSDKLIAGFQEKFDRVLLDVPCSGTGVLRRNPEIKWNLTPDQLLELKQTQSHILYNYTDMAKIGGIVVYATCSLLAEENEHQIVKFMESRQGKKFKLLKELRIWPQEHDSDGFYAAVLEKTN